METPTNPIPFTIVLASRNAHKAEELSQLSDGLIRFIDLNAIGFEGDIEENGTTFEDNARIKLESIRNLTEFPVLADDSGLEVNELGGAPGVYSARYAGEPVSHSANNQKLLEALSGKSNRTACFRTVLALGIGSSTYCFEGRVEGEILTVLTGENGFGYDPLFVPLGEKKSFAQMSASEKNSLSHRGRAFQNMLSFLRKEGYIHSIPE